jgi:hypothetical protein
MREDNLVLRRSAIQFHSVIFFLIILTTALADSSSSRRNHVNNFGGAKSSRAYGTGRTTLETDEASGMIGTSIFRFDEPECLRATRLD